MVKHNDIMLIMPRKATTTASDVPLAIKRIDAFCKEHAICILRLAKDVEVSQSSLCRFMHNERKSVTRTAQKVLKYIDSWHNPHSANSHAIMYLPDANQAGRELIENAILSLWDGDFQSAQILAPLILSLKSTLDLAVLITSGNVGGATT